MIDQKRRVTAERVMKRKRNWRRGCRTCNWTGWRPSEAQPGKVERCDCLRMISEKPEPEVVDRKMAAAGVD